MSKLALQDLIKILERDVVRNNTCVEMNFDIDNDDDYSDCWLGKMPDRENHGKESYWFGLAKMDLKAYDYDNLHDFLNAKVFNGKSLREIINNVTWHSFDGCDIEERLPCYLGETDCLMFSAPKDS